MSQLVWNLELGIWNLEFGILTLSFDGLATYLTMEESPYYLD